MYEFDDSDHDSWYLLCAHAVTDKIITSIESTDKLRKRRLDMEDEISHSWKHSPIKRHCKELISIDLTLREHGIEHFTDGLF